MKYIEDTVKEVVTGLDKQFFLQSIGEHAYGVYVDVVFKTDLLIGDFDRLRRVLRNRGLRVSLIGTIPLFDDRNQIYRTRLYIGISGDKKKYMIRERFYTLDYPKGWE